MIQQDLLKRLQHPDAKQRIRALQVLAMVEETEALPAIAELYRHDADPQVRKTAQWAGHLIHEAQQRGYSTEQGLRRHFGLEASAQTETAHEARLIDGMLIVPNRDDSDTQIQMDLLQTQWQQLDTVQSRREPPPAVPRLSRSEHQPDYGVLDAGLSRPFRLYLREHE